MGGFFRSMPLICCVPYVIPLFVLAIATILTVLADDDDNIDRITLIG